MVKYDRITALAKENGVSKAHLCSLLGWNNRHYLRDCEKSNKQLSDSELYILSGALRTSVDYLTGKTDEKSPSPDEDRLSVEEYEVLKMVRRLDDTARKVLITQIRALSDSSDFADDLSKKE